MTMPAWNGESGARWASPSLQNSWANVGGTVATAAYRRDAGVVRLKGTVDGGSGVNIFILPEGFRPGQSLQFAVPVGAGTGRVDVRDTGQIVLGVGTVGVAVSLDGVSFIAEQ